ncbi:KilA-N domain-containing protein [Marinobacterium stanieri]|uniref:KilA-N domain-containing protein n=1 Tax=Marinobacterium stanieri TaxID=49186 RepID=UPI003A93B6D3
MSNVIKLPVIAGVEITTDEHGRFNLNALHRASGLGKHKAPNEWMRTKQAKELIGELEPGISGFKSVEVRKGRGITGTFAHELLAISYAGWISPAFQLKVNQVFLDYRAGRLNTNQALPSRKELAQLVIEAEEEAERLRLVNTNQADKIDKLENLFRSGMTIAQFGRMLNGVNVMTLSDYVANTLGWIYNGSRTGKSKKWRAHHSARDKYVTETEFQVGAHGHEAFMKPEVRLLAEGAKYLHHLYLQGGLPMKKTWNGQYTHMKVTATGQIELLTGVQAA